MRYARIVIVTVLLLAGCAPIEKQLPKEGAADREVFRISRTGRSKDIKEEAMKSAYSFCEALDKRFRFRKNVFKHKKTFGVDFVSYDLFFSCRDVDEKETGKPEVPEVMEEPDAGIPETETLEKIEDVEAPGGAPGEAEPPSGKDDDAKAGQKNRRVEERPDISETGLGKPESLGFEKNAPEKSKNSGKPDGRGLIVEEVIEK